MAPSDADKMENAGKVLKTIIQNRTQELSDIGGPVPQKFQLGQWVRIRRHPADPFHKTGQSTISKNWYKIVGIHPTSPVISYYLQTRDQLQLPGSYLQTDLIPTHHV